MQASVDLWIIPLLSAELDLRHGITSLGLGTSTQIN
jgi:hypothetical protein